MYSLDYAVRYSQNKLFKLLLHSLVAFGVRFPAWELLKTIGVAFVGGFYKTVTK